MRARSSRIFVEADGELLGTLPAAISVVPDALTLLVPRMCSTAGHEGIRTASCTLCPWWLMLFLLRTVKVKCSNESA